MKLNESLIKSRQKMNRTQMELAKAREQERKLDAHKKIQFGGLVLKSGMGEFPKAVILGALTDALQNIRNDRSFENLYKIKGEKEFLES